MPLTNEERRTLLLLARQALEDCVAATPQVSRAQAATLEEAAGDPALCAPRGAFVTLRKEGRLRGCIGYVEPRAPLAVAVVENARHAALSDPRFPSVTPDEVARITIEISALTPLQPVARAEEIVIGRDGLVVTGSGRRGLLLPQVATEHGLTVEEFLTETCHKAGLPGDAWRHGAQVSRFEAEVFGEDRPGGGPTGGGSSGEGDVS